MIYFTSPVLKAVFPVKAASDAMRRGRTLRLINRRWVLNISGNSRRYLFIAVSVALLTFTGCGSEKKEQKTAQEGAPQAISQQAAPVQAGPPAGHPAAGGGEAATAAMAAHSGMKSQKEVKLSKEVMAKWNEVTLDIVDAASKKKETVVLKVGATKKLANPGFTLKIETFVPDYVIVDTHIESRSNEPKNPAVLVALLEGDKTVAKGWVFKALPDFNSYIDPRYQVTLVGPWAGEKTKKK